RTDRTQPLRRVRRTGPFPPRSRLLPAWGPTAREPDTDRARSRARGGGGALCPPLNRRSRQSRKSRSPADLALGRRCEPRRSPRSVAMDEARPEVGLPPVTAGTRTGPYELITERELCPAARGASAVSACSLGR